MDGDTGMKIMHAKRKARKQTNIDATTYTYNDTNGQTNKEMFTCTDMGEKVWTVWIVDATMDRCDEIRIWVDKILNKLQSHQI